jgi:hypothetical protein
MAGFLRVLPMAAGLCTVLAAMGVYAAGKTIVAPMFDGSRPDRCRTWAADCGKPAGAASCGNRGLRAAACDQAPCDGAKTTTCAM